MIAIIGGLIVGAWILWLAIRKPVLFKMGFGYTRQRPKQTAFIVAGLMVTTTVVAGAGILADSFTESYLASEGNNRAHYDGFLDSFYSGPDADWAGYFADERVASLLESREPFVESRAFLQDESRLGAETQLYLFSEKTLETIGQPLAENTVLLQQRFADEGRLKEGDSVFIDGTVQSQSQPYGEFFSGQITAFNGPTGWVVAPGSQNQFSSDLPYPPVALFLNSSLPDYEVDVTWPTGETHTYRVLGSGIAPVPSNGADGVGEWQFEIRAEAVAESFTFEPSWQISFDSHVGGFEGTVGGVVKSVQLPLYLHSEFAIGNLGDFSTPEPNGYLLNLAPGTNAADAGERLRSVANEYDLNVHAFLGSENPEAEAALMRVAANLAFLSMGGLSIISGVVLIVVLMGLLVEERKRALGTMRALGATRGNLTFLHVSEGSFYALMAGGIGIIGGLLMAVFLLGSIEQVVGDGEEVVLSANPIGYIGAGVASALLILGVITFSAYRISKIDIATAIRGEEQDARRDRKKARNWAMVWAILGGIFLLLGAITGNASHSEGYYESQAAPGLSLGVSIGIALLAIGLAPWFGKYVGRGPALTFISAGMLVHTALSFTYLKMDSELDGLSVMVRLVTIPVAFGVLVAYSRPLHDLVVRIATRFGGVAALWDSALSTIRNRPARNAMTIAVLGSVLMGITAMGALFATFDVEEQGELGGYNAVVQMNDGDLQEAYAFSEVEVAPDSVVSKSLVVESADPYRLFGMSMWSDVWTFDEVVLGATADAVSQTNFAFSSSRANAWDRVLDGSGVILADGIRDDEGVPFRLGRMVGVLGEDREVVAELEVVGILRGVSAITGFVASEYVEAHEREGQTALLASDDAGYAVRVWESAYRSLGARGVDVQTTVAEESAEARVIQTFLFSFMGLGIVIGMISLGLTTTRNVMMRRHEVGVLRAIGAKTKDVVTIFSIETGYVTAFSILLGLAGGLGMAAAVIKGVEGLDIDLKISWPLMLTLYGFTVLSAAIATVIPAYMASKIRPAEAVRYGE
ncbi:MAG: ABC transporter permease [Thermoplasmatota archaeon]